MKHKESGLTQEVSAKKGNFNRAKISTLSF